MCCRRRARTGLRGCCLRPGTTRIRSQRPRSGSRTFFEICCNAIDLPRTSKAANRGSSLCRIESASLIELRSMPSAITLRRSGSLEIRYSSLKSRIRRDLDFAGSLGALRGGAMVWRGRGPRAHRCYIYPPRHSRARHGRGTLSRSGLDVLQAATEEENPGERIGSFLSRRWAKREGRRHLRGLRSSAVSAS